MKQLHIEFWFLPNTVSGTGTIVLRWTIPLQVSNTLMTGRKKGMLWGDPVLLWGTAQGSVEVTAHVSTSQPCTAKSSTGYGGMQTAEWTSLDSMHFRCQQCWRDSWRGEKKNHRGLHLVVPWVPSCVNTNRASDTYRKSLKNPSRDWMGERLRMQ